MPDRYAGRTILSISRLTSWFGSEYGEYSLTPDNTLVSFSLPVQNLVIFRLVAFFMAMLFNDAVLNDQYGFLPLQAFGELRNTNWRISAGLQFDVFAPKTPTVLAVFCIMFLG